MLTISVFNVVTIFATTQLLSAAPVSNAPQVLQLSERQLGNCSDLGHNLSPECWNVLNMTGHLNDWWEQNGKECQAHNISFTSCYQQMAGWEQEQCDTTGPNMCNYPADLLHYTPHQAYTLYTIFAIWQWFQSIYEAIGNADLSATGRVGKIVEAINPKKPPSQPLGDFLQALTAMTPLISAPATMAEKFGTFIGKALTETAMRQSPGVIKQLSPTGTLDSEFVQVNDLYDGLTTVKTTYQKNISTALSLVQQDFATFRAFAAEGAFIAPRASLEANTENLTRSLETYVVSQCLRANNIIVTLARDTDPRALAYNGSVSRDLISCDSYDSYGVCSAWWYDPGSNAAYSLENTKNLKKNYYELMEEIFSSGWTTGADLFLGAKDCADYVRAVGADKGPGLDPVNMKPRCISSIQVCVWSTQCELTDHACQFTGEYGEEGCRAAPEYLLDGCGGVDTFSVRVPASYTGALVTTDNPTIEVCK